MPNLQINLTDKQYKEMLADYDCADEHRKRMTQSEIQSLAKKVNQEIDIPLIKERKEGKILLKIILKVDRFLYDNLPNEIYDLIRSLDDGISEQEAKTIAKRLAKLANAKIDIPYIPESIEYVLFNLIIGLIVNAMRKKWDIDTAISKVTKVNIPDSLEETALEAMIIPE